MTHFKVSLLLLSTLAFGACAVDGTDPDDTEVGTEEAVPTEESPEVAQLARDFNAQTNAHLQTDGTVQFWCDKQLKDSGTAVDNAKCRHRWWKLWYKTFPCSSYTMEYGPWVAGC